MINCGAPGCTNRSTESKYISFHRLTTDKKIRKKWLHVLKREIISQTLCSDHFQPTFFERDLIVI